MIGPALDDQVNPLLRMPPVAGTDYSTKGRLMSFCCINFFICPCI